MTWQALMKEELERLRQADIPEADSDIRLLAMDVAGCTYSTLILRMAEEVTEKQAQRLHAYVTERMTHKPCQYILGTQEFMGYEFATAGGSDSKTGDGIACRRSLQDRGKLEGYPGWQKTQGVRSVLRKWLYRNQFLEAPAW